MGSSTGPGQGGSSQRHVVTPSRNSQTPSTVRSPAGIARTCRSSPSPTRSASAILTLTGRSRARSARITGASGCRGCTRASSSCTYSISVTTGPTCARSVRSGSTQSRSWESCRLSRCRTSAGVTSLTSTAVAGTQTTENRPVHMIPGLPTFHHYGLAGDRPEDWREPGVQSEVLASGFANAAKLAKMWRNARNGWPQVLLAHVPSRKSPSTWRRSAVNAGNCPLAVVRRTSRSMDQ